MAEKFWTLAELNKCLQIFGRIFDFRLRSRAEYTTIWESFVQKRHQQVISIIIERRAILSQHLFLFGIAWEIFLAWNPPFVFKFTHFTLNNFISAFSANSGPEIG